MATAPNNFSAMYSSGANPTAQQWAWAHMLAHATSANMQPHQQRIYNQSINHPYQQCNQHQQVVTTQSQPPPWPEHPPPWIPLPPFQQNTSHPIQSMPVNSSAQFNHQSSNAFRCSHLRMKFHFKILLKLCLFFIYYYLFIHHFFND